MSKRPRFAQISTSLKKSENCVINCRKWRDNAQQLRLQKHSAPHFHGNCNLLIAIIHLRSLKSNASIPPRRPSPCKVDRKLFLSEKSAENFNWQLSNYLLIPQLQTEIHSQGHTFQSKFITGYDGKTNYVTLYRKSGRWSTQKGRERKHCHACNRRQRLTVLRCASVIYSTPPSLARQIKLFALFFDKKECVKKHQITSAHIPVAGASDNKNYNIKNSSSYTMLSPFRKLPSSSPS
jgi:hypothetical protein